ncbi:hypothetical protein ACFSSA_06925 [Luteolibacter algae]|uniref:Uncharacterized protein n=1 Tax=Luteolibacter algae TaxID=454151 RepID=A0ABW5D6N2_9BACT
MKTAVLFLLFTAKLFATTISVIPVHEPLSLHGTDVDDIISDTGEALQATVLPRPMALTGAFPEVLVEAIRTPHLIPTNNPNYRVSESNLLVLCNVGIAAQMTEEGLLVTMNLSELEIPQEVDITSRQLLKLTLVALQRTLEEYHKPQTDPLKVTVAIDGTTEKNATLKDLEVTFTLEPSP